MRHDPQPTVDVTWTSLSSRTCLTSSVPGCGASPTGSSLRDRATRQDELLEALLPEPIVDPTSGDDPEYQALLADAVGIALQVVLETLSPAGRLAFVLHDMFAVPFGEIAALVGRMLEATRQLASRARRRVRDAAPEPEPNLARQRAVVDAFFAASRDGNLDALITVLDPDIVIRAHGRAGVRELRGAEQVARGAVMWRTYARSVRGALINGAAGVIAYDGDRPFALLAFTIVDDRAVAIDVFNNRELVPSLLRGGQQAE